MTNLNRNTEILYQGSRIARNTSDPETLPLYMTTAFNVDDLAALKQRYAEQGYTYIRTRNPNRAALAQLITYLENGEDSLICPSGMAAISTTLLAITKTNSHIIADKTLYGESIDLLNSLSKFDIHVTFVNMYNMDEVKEAFTDQTVAVYTETISNPMINTVDFAQLAKLSHEHHAELVVDNTFATSHIVAPIDLGADIVINSLTKFANGHSDVCIGSVTSTKAMIKKIYDLQVLLGTTADPFACWLCERGIKTMELRVQCQSENALKLADFLTTVPAIRAVHYIGLSNHPQQQLAKAQFKNQCFGGMLSFELPENEEKINQFLDKLTFVHYAMTLGGIKTTISNPATSSHYDMPREQRLNLGITDGLMRISVGIENSDDLIEEFKQALSVYES